MDRLWVLVAQKPACVPPLVRTVPRWQGVILFPVRIRYPVNLSADRWVVPFGARFATLLRGSHRDMCRAILLSPWRS